MDDRDEWGGERERERERENLFWFVLVRNPGISNIVGYLMPIF